MSARHDLTFRGLIALIVCAILASGALPPTRAAELKAVYPAHIPMKDGVHLAADVYLPGEPGRYPAILIRTPYDPKIKPPVDFPLKLAAAGYAVVVNHCRGRYDSQGSFMPFKAEGRDGFDTVEWIVKQPWCDGQVGLMGSSYSGMAAWKLAVMKNPHVKAMFVIVAPADLYRDIVFPGGAFALDTSFWWFSIVDRRTVQDWKFNDWQSAIKHLPVLTIDEQLGRRFDVLRDMMAHPAYGQYWKNFYSMDDEYYRVDIPVYIVGGWNDSFVTGVLETYAGMRRAFGQRKDLDDRVQAIVGPWDHFGAISGAGTTFGDMNYGKSAAVDLSVLAASWFDRWLKGKELKDWQHKPLRYFLSGENSWQECGDWPPADAQAETFYLDSNGQANGSGNGNGRLVHDMRADSEPDRFQYDPANPTPSVVSKKTLNNSSVKDIASLEKRSDVLVYTSEALTEDLPVTGNARLILKIRSDAPDTDLVAWLTEVLPDGRSLSLTDGVVRCGRFLHPEADHPTLEVNQAYTFEINLGAIAHVFKAGNRIRLDVSSSNFPAIERNLNTGRDNWQETHMRAAAQVVMHDRQAPSRLILPVVH